MSVTLACTNCGCRETFADDQTAGWPNHLVVFCGDCHQPGMLFVRPEREPVHDLEAQLERMAFELCNVQEETRILAAAARMVRGHAALLAAARAHARAEAHNPCRRLGGDRCSADLQGNVSYCSEAVQLLAEARRLTAKALSHFPEVPT